MIREGKRIWLLPFLMVGLIGSLLLFERQRREARAPITYRIGQVDPRFRLDRAEFEACVNQAAGLWRKAVGREVFRAEAKGAVEVNLVYDHRQEAADRLKALSFKIENTKGTYDDLKARFATLKRDSDAVMEALNRDFDDYNAQVRAFNARMEDARRRGGADEGMVRSFESDQRQLAARQVELQRRQEELKGSLDTLRSLAVVINDIAASHNLDVVNYGEVGSRLGQEFSEGEYERQGTRRTITIYHYPSRDGLVRVLAHEIGHALGLKHLEHPDAVMHRLMRHETPELTGEDVAALKAALK